MSDEDISAQIAALTGEIRDLGNRRVEAVKAGDGQRAAESDAGATAVSAQLVALSKELSALRDAQDKDRKAEIAEAVKAELSNRRAPSMAASLSGNAPDPTNRRGRMDLGAGDEAHPALKAIFRDYRAGEMLEALNDKTWGMHEGNFEQVNASKAKLDELGMVYGSVPESSKATLGTTGTLGGYVLPNNLVDTLVKPNVQEAVYQTLVTVRNGVSVRGVDQPYRLGVPTRMTFIDWGALKENVNETYGSYTASLGTMARVYDISKQYARFSAGSAEADVMDELGKAAILGENFYILAGVGTGTGGYTGDPTTGVYTALTAAGVTGYTTTGAPVAGTIAGSAAAQLASAFGAMATRSRRPTAVVTDAVTYWTMFAQGSDTAGFFMSELLGAGFQIGADNALRFRGVPILYDANFNTNTSTTKRAIVADWKVFKLLRGQEFRIDTSDTAGTRWDYNLVGWRGEEEIGFNAKPGVFVGAAQLVVGLIP